MTDGEKKGVGETRKHLESLESLWISKYSLFSLKRAETLDTLTPKLNLQIKTSNYVCLEQNRKGNSLK